jgi:hypothetical protein
MKRLLLYGMGLTLSMAVATASFAGNTDTKKDGNKKECTSKDKKACTGKCTGNKACCKDKKTVN